MLWPVQDFGIKGDEYIMEKVRVFNTTCLLVLFYASTKYYQNTGEVTRKQIGELCSGKDQVDVILLGPVVQSVVSLTSSLRVISLTVLADSIYNILIFFAEKM